VSTPALRREDCSSAQLNPTRPKFQDGERCRLQHALTAEFESPLGLSLARHAVVPFGLSKAALSAEW